MHQRSARQSEHHLVLRSRVLPVWVFSPAATQRHSIITEVVPFLLFRISDALSPLAPRSLHEANVETVASPREHSIETDYGSVDQLR